MFILQTPRAQKHQTLSFCCCVWAHTHTKHTEAATAQTSPTKSTQKSTELLNSKASPAENQAALGKHRENVLRSRTLQTGLKCNT